MVIIGIALIVPFLPLLPSHMFKVLVVWAVAFKGCSFQQLLAFPLQDNVDHKDMCVLPYSVGY